MSEGTIKRLVKINARINGMMQPRWVEVYINLQVLAQDYGNRAYNSSGGRAQLAGGAIRIVASEHSPEPANVPTGTRVDVNAGINAILGATPDRDRLRREAHAVNPNLCGPDCGCQK